MSRKPGFQGRSRASRVGGPRQGMPRGGGPSVLIAGELAVRTRRLLLAAFSAAAGVAAIGTVLAQQPSSGYGQPVAPPGSLSGTTVKPYNQWTPNGQPGGVQPAGGYLPTPPPGYTPVNQAGNRPRLTQPVMAGPDGVRPVGGIDLPPPSMDIPAFRPGTGATPPPPRTPT